MNETYKAIAKAIRTNTLKSRTIIKVVDKNGLVGALCIYFKETDTFFDPIEFAEVCNVDW